MNPHTSPNHKPFVNDENFELDINKSKIIGVETIMKREGASAFEDLTEKEKKIIIEESKEIKKLPRLYMTSIMKRHNS